MWTVMASLEAQKDQDRTKRTQIYLAYLGLAAPGAELSR